LDEMLSLTQGTTKTLAEVGFLLIVISGVWIVASEVLPTSNLSKVRRIVAGAALALAGILLIIAIHWGRFG
jgi:hypothetical protein